VLADLSPVMLEKARVRLNALEPTRTGPRPPLEFVAGDLLHEDLGLAGFDVVLLGWGLRYVEDVDLALSRMHSFLRPGGRLVVLEFTRPPRLSWATPVHYYFRHILPRIGSWLARDRELHDYLSVSAAEFLTVASLRDALGEARFDVTSCRTHFDGLVTIVAANRRRLTLVTADSQSNRLLGHRLGQFVHVGLGDGRPSRMVKKVATTCGSSWVPETRLSSSRASAAVRALR